MLRHLPERALHWRARTPTQVLREARATSQSTPRPVPRARLAACALLALCAFGSPALANKAFCNKAESQIDRETPTASISSERLALNDCVKIKAKRFSDHDKNVSAALQDLRRLKGAMEAQRSRIDEIEQHMRQLVQFYDADPEGAFRARLPMEECTERVSRDLCNALWPFYVHPEETGTAPQTQEVSP